jgi:hypothetical protein
MRVATLPAWASFAINVLLAADVPLQSIHYQVGELLFQDDFQGGLGEWSIEAERPGIVEARGGLLNINVPAGITVWFKRRLEGPILIQYQATAIQAGGPNDRVSDLNCFWMANDSRSPLDLFAIQRSGDFADYDRLKTYYVGQGGNGNSTTRFRRYIGQSGSRPLRPEHDLSEAAQLLKPNVTQTIDLVAAGERIEYWRDGKLVFGLLDPEPYTSGYFAFRSTYSHIQFQRFRVYRLLKVH